MLSDTFNPVNPGLRLDLLCMADRASLLANPDREVSLKAFNKILKALFNALRFWGLSRYAYYETFSLSPMLRRWFQTVAYPITYYQCLPLSSKSLQEFVYYTKTAVGLQTARSSHQTH